MHDQHRTLPEAFVAHGAAERSLSSVNALMLLHILMSPEYFSTVRTGKAISFSNTQMLWMSDTLMFYQREGERKPPVAQCAVVWSFFRMMSPVVFSEVYGLAEVFPALGALVRLLSGVNAQMDPKLRLLMKSLSTVTALMRLVFITRLLLSCKRLLDALYSRVVRGLR